MSHSKNGFLSDLLYASNHSDLLSLKQYYPLYKKYKNMVKIS